MQVIFSEGLIRSEKADEKFVKSLRLNKDTSELVRSLLKAGMLEVHIQSIVDSYRSGVALRANLRVLSLHWVKSPLSKKSTGQSKPMVSLPTNSSKKVKGK